MRLLSSAESRELDRLSREKYGIAPYALMTRAGAAVAQSLLRHLRDCAAAGVLVIAGKGNNGGDGMVAALKLQQEGVHVRVVLLGSGEALRGEARQARADYLNAGGVMEEVAATGELERTFAQPHGALVDALFGTGLNAEVTGPARHALELMNAGGAPIIAVDIASGVSADTGAVMGAAARARRTVTFGFAKFGHVSYPGAAFTGDLEIADIGFAPGAIGEIAPRGVFLEAAEVRALLRPRPTEAHKGLYGHPLIVAGGRGKSGAVLLAARAALRTGAGLVTAAIPEGVFAVVAAGQAELMTEPMPERDGHFDAERAPAALLRILAGKTALVAGPGMGLSDDTRRLVSWLATEASAPGRPLLIDADALNALAQLGPGLLKRARGAVVLTPHPGEMARLLSSTAAEVNADRISAARRLAEIAGACVLLKGARSVIAGPCGEVMINSTGNPGMATPGMGDALSGILGALLGEALKPLDALALGVFLHGYAADRVARRLGPVGYIAGDLIEELPHARAALGA